MKSTQFLSSSPLSDLEIKIKLFDFLKIINKLINNKNHPSFECHDVQQTHNADISISRSDKNNDADDNKNWEDL